MSAIEGIGDEVLQFFAFVLMVFLAIATWSYASIRGINSYKKLFILFGQWLQGRRAEELPDNSLTLTSTSSVNEVERNGNEDENTVLMGSNSNITDTVSMRASTVGIGTHEHTRRFLQQPRASNVPVESVSDRRDELLVTVTEHITSRQIKDDDEQIKVKLKHLNDSVQIVDGKLNEKLGEFKMRNFNNEISQGKRVLLLFNGRILVNETQTLQSCGLYNDCTVHCLLRGRRIVNNPSATDGSTTRGHSHRSSRNRLYHSDSDLSAVFFTSLSMLMIGIWYSRYRHAELFSVTATVGLIILTGIYIAYCVCSCLPEPNAGLVLVSQ